MYKPLTVLHLHTAEKVIHVLRKKTFLDIHTLDLPNVLFVLSTMVNHRTIKNITILDNMGWPSKNRGNFTPKMDGENNGKRYEQMDDLGPQNMFGSTPICLGNFFFQPSTDPKIQKDDMVGWFFIHTNRINNHPWYLCLEHKLGFVFRRWFFYGLYHGIHHH